MNVQKMLFMITSGEPGKHCDFQPHGSLHHDESKIHYFCEYKPVFDIETKSCPQCKNDFPVYWPFVVPDQKGDTEMCLRCHEKKYVVNREGYYNTLREIIKFEFNLKPITMKQQHPTDGTPITENKEPVTTVSETVAEAEDSVSETVAEAEDSVSPMEKGAPVDVESASNEVTPDSNEQEPSSNAPAPNLNEPEGESFPTGN